jgi:hypothetical protein
MLTVVCFITMGCVVLTGTHKSVSDDYVVVSRIQLLISFVLASYVSIVVGRWDRMRNNLLGASLIYHYAVYYLPWSHSFSILRLIAGGIWSNLENLNYTSFSLLSRDKSELSVKLQNTVLRYSRCALLLTFHALQERDLLDELVSDGLLSAEEANWLSAVTLSTRPHMVVGWLSRTFQEILEKGYTHAIVNPFGVQNHMIGLRQVSSQRVFLDAKIITQL